MTQDWITRQFRAAFSSCISACNFCNAMSSTSAVPGSHTLYRFVECLDRTHQSTFVDPNETRNLQTSLKTVFPKSPNPNPSKFWRPSSRARDETDAQTPVPSLGPGVLVADEILRLHLWMLTHWNMLKYSRNFKDVFRKFYKLAEKGWDVSFLGICMFQLPVQALRVYSESQLRNSLYLVKQQPQLSLIQYVYM